MKDRIAHIMRAKNLKASDFASLLGIQPSAVSHILAGRNKPSLEIVRKIKETFPEYNLDWIIFGTGPVTTSEPFKEASKVASMGTFKDSSAGSSEAALTQSNDAPTSQNAFLTSPNLSPTSQDASFQASIFELETEEETAVEDAEEPENRLPRGGTPVSFPSSGIRSIVIFYEDGTFESFLPR